MVSYAKNKSGTALSVPVAGHGRRKSRGTDTGIEENGAFLINKRSPYKACHLNPSPFKNLHSLESQEEDYSQSSPWQYDNDDTAVGGSDCPHDMDTDQNGSNSSSLIHPVGQTSVAENMSRQDLHMLSTEKKRGRPKSPADFSAVEEVYSTERKKRSRPFSTEKKKICITKSPISPKAFEEKKSSEDPNVTSTGKNKRGRPFSTEKKESCPAKFPVRSVSVEENNCREDPDVPSTGKNKRGRPKSPVPTSTDGNDNMMKSLNITLMLIAIAIIIR